MTLKQRLEPLAWPAYLVLLGTVAIGTFVVEVTAHTHLHTSGAQTTLAAQKCDRVGTTINVEAKSGGFDPATIKAQRCDKVVFKNSTKNLIEVAFGPHDEHIAYPGLSDVPIKQGGSTSVVVSVPGSFPVHDHISDAISGNLVVTN